MSERKPDIEALVDEVTEVGRLRRELRIERDKVARFEEELSAERARSKISEETLRLAEPPEWLVATEKRGKKQATAVLLITDTHFDEVVRPQEMMGLNSYNREIAMGRLERAVRGAVKLAHSYAGWSWDGCVLLFGGDIITGEIHDELRQTNEAPVPETIATYLEPLVAGIKHLRDGFGKVHVAGVVGNHGRRTKRDRSKLRVKDNYDWLLYDLCRQMLSRYSTVTWQIPESPAVVVPVHDTRLLLLHGNDFKGGAGISGAMAPLMLGQHRTQRQYTTGAKYGDPGMSYDIMVCGHFHQRIVLPELIVGGTLKGYDEYARDRHYPFATASQELFAVAPGSGVVWNAPVYVQDREAEGW